jgi:acyl-[acyl carrier protein]--UDP-N-acetylglucosamine O-acyltransferase
MNKPLLVVSPDFTLRDTYALAREIYPQRRVESLEIPVTDYYHFDFSGLAAFPTSEWEVCISVNEFYINDVRRALAEEIEKRTYQKSAALISPHAHVDQSATVGENAIIHAGVFVGAGSNIGHHAVLRPNVFVGEDVEIGNYVTLEANVSIRELSNIGDFTTICANSSLLRSTQVGQHCYLNLTRQYMGAIPDSTFYSPIFENPVRVISG